MIFRQFTAITQIMMLGTKQFGNCGIRTRASEDNCTLNQRFKRLGHITNIRTFSR